MSNCSSIASSPLVNTPRGGEEGGRKYIKSGDVGPTEHEAETGQSDRILIFPVVQHVLGAQPLLLLLQKQTILVNTHGGGNGKEIRDGHMELIPLLSGKY